VKFKMLKFKRRYINVSRNTHQYFVVSMSLSSRRIIEIIIIKKMVGVFNTTFITVLEVRFDRKL